MIIYEITIGEIINILILSITAWIVWRYTQAAQKSNEIQERPTLNLYLDEFNVGQNIRHILKLKNVGNGPAYNIKFFGIKADGYTYYPYFNEPNPILEKNGNEKEINLWISMPSGGVEHYDNIIGFERLLQRIFEKSNFKDGGYENARSALIFLITFEGINGNKYYSIFRIYPKISLIYDLVVEFILSDKGDCDLLIAKQKCEERPIMKKNEQ